MDNGRSIIKILKLCIAISFLSFANITNAYAADNPCGVSCAQTIAENAAASAVNSRVYEKVVIVSENTANITAGSGLQWAYGDGDTGAIGVPLAENWELYAISFQARSVTVNTNVNMIVRDVNTATTLYAFTAPLLVTPPAANSVYTEVLANPVPISAGTTIGLATSSVSAGVVTGARVAMWLRRHPN